MNLKRIKDSKSNSFQVDEVAIQNAIDDDTYDEYNEYFCGKGLESFEDFAKSRSESVEELIESVDDVPDGFLKSIEAGKKWRYVNDYEASMSELSIE